MGRSRHASFLGKRRYILPAERNNHIKSMKAKQLRTAKNITSVVHVGVYTSKFTRAPLPSLTDRCMHERQVSAGGSFDADEGQVQRRECCIVSHDFISRLAHCSQRNLNGCCCSCTVRFAGLLQPSGLVRSNNSFCFASASASARVTASSSEVCAESVRTENVQ